MISRDDWPRFMTGNGESRQLHIRQVRPAAHHILRTEKGQTVIRSKTDQIIVCMKTHRVDILLCNQAITVDVAYIGFLLDVILPQAHRRRAPDIPVVSFYDIANHLISHFLHQLRLF